MKVTILNLETNSSSIKIESNDHDLQGIWIITNIAPYHEEFTKIIRELERAEDPLTNFKDVRQKYRVRRDVM